MPATKFASQELIPEALRPYYKQVGGEWVFDHAQFDGIAALVVPGLEANRLEWQQNRERERTLRQAAETELAQAKNELASLKQPGTIVLSEADAKTYRKLTELGDYKTVAEKVQGYDKVNGELTNLKRREAFRDVSRKAGLNEEVLVDVMESARGQGLEVFTRPVETTDAKGQKKTQEVAFVKILKQENGQAVQTEANLLEHAKANNWPQYIIAGLTAQPAAATQQGQQGAQTRPAQAATSAAPITYPAVGANSGQQAGNVDVGSVVDKLNKRRSTVQSPFAKPAQAEQ